MNTSRLVTAGLAVLGASSLAHAEGFGMPRLAHSSFATGSEVPLTGDFNNDGRDDIVSFVRTSGASSAGSVWVALSNGLSFGTSQLWHSAFAGGSAVPLVGNFDGLGGDDIVVFIQSSQGGAAMGDVFVALSSGTRFGPSTRWHDWMSYGNEVPAVGDMDGDGKDDIITFVRDTATGAAQGDVWVALSTGTGFGTPYLAHGWFNPGQGVPKVADVDGNRRADLVSFVRDSEGGDARGDVRVALSFTPGFGPTYLWHTFFGIGNEPVRIGDFDGDTRADIATFVRDTQAAPARGDVWVGLSNGSFFDVTHQWHTSLALGDEVPVIGDVDGDRRADVVVFVQDTQWEPRRGDVQVALTGDPSWADGGSFATGYDTMRVYGAQARGTRPLLSIMLNFTDVQFAADRQSSYFRDRLFSNSTHNAARLFREMSGGRFGWSNAGVLGPFVYRDDPATGANEGRFGCSLGYPGGAPAPYPCGGTSANERVARRKAIEMAFANGFNFAPFDTNRDGYVKANELQVMVISAGNSAATRTADWECVSPGAGSTVQVCPGWIPSTSQSTNFATMAHELAHALGTIDIYGSKQDHNRGGSLQGPSDFDEGLHLDPWHKIQLGWTEPVIYDVAQPGSCAILDAAYVGGDTPGNNRRPILLFDSRRTNGDYFLLEHRARGGADEHVTGDGLMIWQLRNAAYMNYGFIAHTSLAQTSGQEIWPGIDLIRNSWPAPGSDDVIEGLNIGAGADRFMQTVPAGDDVMKNDIVNLTFGSPGGLRGWATSWTIDHGYITLRYPDQSMTELVLRVSSTTAYPGQLAVKWAWHGFRSERPWTSYADPTLRSCYIRFP